MNIFGFPPTDPTGTDGGGSTGDMYANNYYFNTDNTGDLGQVAKRARKVYAVDGKYDGTLTAATANITTGGIGALTATTGNVTTGTVGTLASTTITNSGTITSGNYFFPTDNTGDVGQVLKRARKVWANDMQADGEIDATYIYAQSGAVNTTFTAGSSISAPTINSSLIGVFNQLSATTATIGSLTSTNATVTNTVITTGTFGTTSTVTASVTGAFTATSGNITTGTIGTLTSTNGTITNMTSSNIQASGTTGVIGTYASPYNDLHVALPCIQGILEDGGSVTLSGSIYKIIDGTGGGGSAWAYPETTKVTGSNGTLTIGTLPGTGARRALIIAYAVFQNLNLTLTRLYNLFLYKNGSIYYQGISTPVAGSAGSNLASTLSLSTMVQIATGDTFDIRCQCSSSQASYIVNAGIQLIGLTM